MSHHELSFGKNKIRFQNRGPKKIGMKSSFSSFFQFPTQWRSKGMPETET